MIRAWLQRREQQASRMGKMLQRMEVDVVALASRGEGYGLRQAISACAQCNRVDTCERSLADWEAGRKDAADPAGFCPNAERFATCCSHK